MVQPTPSEDFLIFKSKSVISVMMIIVLNLGTDVCCFEGAMGFHCNRKATEQMSKRWLH